MGEVFSRAQGFRTLGEMAPALAFHFVFCLAGMSCFVQVARRKAARPAPTVVV
jgi:hypothetical protein